MPRVDDQADGPEDVPDGTPLRLRTVDPRPAPPALTERERRVGAAVDRWRADLLELGGESALADITLLGAAAVDLTAAHPSGIAQLFAGRPTLLSNLIREGAALSAARRRARTVLARADELAQRYGVAPTYLAIGIGTWTSVEEVADDAPAPVTGAPTAPDADVPAPDADADTDADTPVALPAGTPLPGTLGVRTVVRTVRAPLLLRPVRLAARSESEIDVVLEPSVEVNPVLLRALRAVDVDIDAAGVARETISEHGFSPSAALARLRALGERSLTDFQFSDHLVLGPFVHPGQVLAQDLDARRAQLAAHDVVAALAGDPTALADVSRPLPPVVLGDRDPVTERGVSDLDPSQQRAVDAVASGAHVFVDAPPGADAAGTVAGILADAAASGRHVLYVPGTRRAGDGLSAAMQAEGLGELLLDLSGDAQWRSRAGARLATGSRVSPPPVDDEAVRRMRAELVDTRRRLGGYIEGLHTPRSPWGVSAHDALQSLAALTSARVSPRTRVRLAPATLAALDAETRAASTAELRTAGDLGAFSVRPEDTPWFGAAIRTPEAAREAATLVARLSEESLPALRRRITDATAQTGLERPVSLRAWGEQLEMLDGVREALDVFQPVVFERSPADLVAATATRAWRAERGIAMRWGVRRRLKRQARDMIRPGRAISDLHGALVHVEEQREVWARHCPAGGWPRLPEGLAQCEAELRTVEADVDALEPVLVSTVPGAGLADLPLADLEARCRRLAADVGALDELPARTVAVDRLVARGLGDLVVDLAERAVPTEQAGSELELAWWSSVLEEILRADPALAGYDGAALGALADRFRELDAAQVDSLPGPVRVAVAQHLRRALLANPGAREILAELAAERVRDLKDAVGRLGPLAGALRPCWLVAPMQVPQLLPAEQSVDLLVIDAAQHLPVEQAVSAIARARQVVVVGDSRRAALDSPGAPLGIVDALAEVLPHVALSADRVVREPGLMAFLGEHGYEEVARAVPTPSTRPSVRLDLVEGFGLPLPGSELVESGQTEVDHVVDLVIDHALSRPEESLVVLTVTLRHADRIREAVRSAVADSPAVRELFAPERPEPFAVLDLDSAAGVRRDAVILSLGLGKTPHGRVMHRFGRVSDPDGAGLLIDAIDACRRRLTVVSCFAPDELDRWRLKTPGPILLGDLLEAAATGAALPSSIPSEGEPDRLLVDLAERLWQLGLTVVSRYGVPGGVRIPLAIGHPELPDDLLLAVLTDDVEYVAQPSLRIRDRHDVQRLVDRGWAVHMAFSTAVFMDPQAEAEQILSRVLALVEARRGGAPASPPAPAGHEDAVDVPMAAVGSAVVPQVLDDDADDDVPPVLGPDAPRAVEGVPAEPADAQDADPESADTAPTDTAEPTIAPATS